MTGSSLVVVDRVYGQHVFTHPLLIELVHSRFIQRLKGITQHGVPEKYYHRKGFSRFEHSVGVAVLLAKNGASVNEQAAGLLHDVSHTAFSHVVDEAFGSSEREDFQDNAMPEFINSREMIRMLAKYGLDPEEFLDLKAFTLLEQPIPKLCADRIDYCLRELAVEGVQHDAREIALGLTVVGGEFCFKTLEIARRFALAYSRLQRNPLGGKRSKGEVRVAWSVTESRI